MRGKVQNRVVATGTISHGARIYLGRSVLRILGAEVGDFFEIWVEASTGKLYLDKVKAPPLEKPEAVPDV